MKFNEFPYVQFLKLPYKCKIKYQNTRRNYENLTKASNHY